MGFRIWGKEETLAAPPDLGVGKSGKDSLTPVARKEALRHSSCPPSVALFCHGTVKGAFREASPLPLLICRALFRRGNGGGRIQDTPSEGGGKREIGWVMEDMSRRGKWAKVLCVLLRAEGK